MNEPTRRRLNLTAVDITKLFIPNWDPDPPLPPDNNIRACLDVIFQLANALCLRDFETDNHLERMRYYCLFIANQLREKHGYGAIITNEYLANLFHAVPLHDIGKASVSEEILNKPGRLLTDDELKMLKFHPRTGAAILKPVLTRFPENVFVTMCSQIAEYHHAHWDGKGTPEGVAGKDIPLCARIACVADVYDMMRMYRPHALTRSHASCIEIIKKYSGEIFDPVVVQAFLEVATRIREIRLTLVP